jgi:type VI secretion system protein ImpA
MTDRVQKLLAPISADSPCGPDLSYDPKFDELETALRGQPEVEIGSVVRPAEPPDWRAVAGLARDLLGETKHLRVAVALACAWLKTEGGAGLRDGLELIQGLLAQYWPTLHPLLDPDDNNDPTFRLNILRALTSPRGSISGWLVFTDNLYELPLAQPRGQPPVTLTQLQAARKKTETGAGEGPDLAAATTALRAAGAEALAARAAELEAALAATRGIDRFLTEQLGAGEAISFEILEGLLGELLGVLRPLLGAAAPAAGSPEPGATETPAGSAAGGAAPAAAGAIIVSGSIRSREDVARALDALCDYYQQVEPGSPVPFLLRRAQKMAAMNFVQAVQELNLANLDALRPSMGSALDGLEAPPAS